MLWQMCRHHLAGSWSGNSLARSSVLLASGNRVAAPSPARAVSTHDSDLCSRRCNASGHASDGKASDGDAGRGVALEAVAIVVLSDDDTETLSFVSLRLRHAEIRGTYSLMLDRVILLKVTSFTWPLLPVTVLMRMPISVVRMLPMIRVCNLRHTVVRVEYLTVCDLDVGDDVVRTTSNGADRKTMAARTVASVKDKTLQM